MLCTQLGGRGYQRGSRRIYLLLAPLSLSLLACVVLSVPCVGDQIVEQFEVRLAPEQRAELLEEISAFLSPQMAENGVAQESAPQGEEEEQAEEPEEEAAMEVEGAIEAVELGGEEEEDNELLHEEETKAGEEEEGMAADGEEDDAGQGQDNN